MMVPSRLRLAFCLLFGAVTVVGILLVAGLSKWGISFGTPLVTGITSRTSPQPPAPLAEEARARTPRLRSRTRLQPIPSLGRSRGAPANFRLHPLCVCTTVNPETD